MSTATIWRTFLYGAGSALLLVSLFFLIQATLAGNFVPLLPILAGTLTAAGLLLIVYIEHRSRLQDRRDHRRISRVATQLEGPLRSLQDDLSNIVRHTDSLPEEARQIVRRMETKSQVLLENIRDVFLTLQAQEGKLAHELRVYDACTLVQETVRRLQPLAGARNVELDAKKYCEDAAIKVDKRLFILALTHLIENGILYTLHPGKVNVSVTRGAKSARILVEDRGVGIKAEDAPVIFQPFARGHAAAQFDPDGIGVGLTLSRLIIRQFGGDIIWRSHAASPGSEFEITLPLVKVLSWGDRWESDPHRRDHNPVLYH